MNLKKLEQLLRLDDFEFKYKKRTYFICPFNDYFSAGEANKTEKEYKSFDDLINNFIVQGEALKSILKDIEW